MADYDAEEIVYSSPPPIELTVEWWPIEEVPPPPPPIELTVEWWPIEEVPPPPPPIELFFGETPTVELPSIHWQALPIFYDPPPSPDVESNLSGGGPDLRTWAKLQSSDLPNIDFTVRIRKKPSMVILRGLTMPIRPRIRFQGKPVKK